MQVSGLMNTCLKRISVRCFLVGICLLISGLLPVRAQVWNPGQRSSRGVESSQLTGGRVLSFSKGPGKRVLYAAGSQLKVQLHTGEKISGRVNAVRDTDFILAGRIVALDSVSAYFVPMRVCLMVGSALCIAGGGYMVLDGFNGLVNKKKPAFHVEALAVGIPMIAAGAAMIPFKEIKRKTKVWKPACLELW